MTKTDLEVTKCHDCGKQISKNNAVYCYDCGVPLCRDRGTLGLCAACAEAREAEDDLEALEEMW